MSSENGSATIMASLDEKLSELLEWYKAVNFAHVRVALEGVLADNARRVAYELTTPERTGDDIAKAMERLGLDKIAARTIQRWQAEWVRVGLVRQLTPRKRERIFSLPDFGIDLGVDISKLNDKGKQGS